MYVRRLELIDFRGYERVAVDLGPGVYVLTGRNGAGKTNLVEALHYGANLSSHRVATDAPLVRAGESRAIIRIAIVQETRELLVELSIEPGKANRVRLGRAPVSRARDVLGALKLVLFAPEDLALVRGDPERRRRFLDDLLTTRQPRFAGVRADYERVLKQRNALLRTSYLARRAGRSAPGDLSTLDVWDSRLAATGAQLLAGRLELTSALAPYVEKAYAAVSGEQDRLADKARMAGLTYAPSCGDLVTGCAVPTELAWLEKGIGSALAAARPAEIDRGTTLVGPHRDDLVLAIGELPVKGYASHGESWSFALALRLAAFDLLRAEGADPVLVLDDVFAELDTDRRRRLADFVSQATQVIITGAVDADVPEALDGQRLLIEGGQVRGV